MENEYLLKTQYDTRKSFYNKAKVINEDNKLFLISYTTKVGFIDLKFNRAVIFGTYSTTTLRHIKEFLKQNGFTANNKTQILNDYNFKKYNEEIHNIKI